MSLIRTLSAAAILMIASTAADAAVVYGSGATTTAISGVNVLSGNDGNMNGAPDAAIQNFRNQTPATTGTLTISWTFATAPGSIGWVIYTQNGIKRVNVTGITLTDGGALTVSSTNSQALAATSGTGLRANELTNFDSRVDYTGAAGFNYGNITNISVSFSFVNAGVQNNARILVDAIANPEPGTLALFGLGALGLIGVVRRRRGVRCDDASSAVS